MEGIRKYEYRKLRGRVVEKYGTFEAFAKSINRSKVSVSNKMRGKSGFSQKDIELWGNALGIKVTEYDNYFFA